MNIKGAGFNKVKLITHSDFDGTTAAILTKVVFGDSADIDLLVLSQLPTAIYNVINSHDFLTHQYSWLYIVDLSLSENVVDDVAVACRKNMVGFKVFDHHATSQVLSNRPDCIIKEGTDVCGSSIYYDYLFENLKDNSKLLAYKDLVVMTAKYDTGNWSSFNNYLANQLNSLLFILGRRRFIDRFVTDPSIKLTEAETALLLLDEERKSRYVYGKTVVIKKMYLAIPGLGTYFAGLVFANDCYTEITQDVFEKHPDIALLIIMNLPNSISYRVRPGIFDIDVSKIAKYFGGGGHTMAAGNTIPSDIQDQLVSIVFNSIGASAVVV